MTLFKLAWRNILRNPRRSIVSSTAIALGLAALIFLWAFIDGVNAQMIENSTRFLAGHVQVHRSGHHEQRTLDLLVAAPDRIEAQLKAAPAVRATSRRFEGFAVASAEDKSRGIMVVGIDAQREREVTTLHSTIKAGRFLQPGDDKQIVLGDLSAAALHVGVGGEVVLLTQAADGSVGAGSYRVAGIFDTRMDSIDGMVVLLPIATAQQLFAAGESVTAIVARLDRRDAAATIAERLRQSLGTSHEVLTWAELLPSVMQSVAFHEVVGYVLLLVLFTVVAVGITNTMLMAVTERTREFGVMRALGTADTQVMRLVFFEACLLGAIGLAAGIAAGLGLVYHFSLRGMDLTRFSSAVETMPGLTSIIYPFARFDRVQLLSALVFVTALVAALYPAWRAVRLAPVAAIRGLHPRVAWHWRAAAGERTRPFPLPVFWKISARSIARNPRRTLLTVSATSFGLAAFVFLLSFVGGFLVQITENSTGYLSGDLQIQHPDFRREFAATLSLRSPAALLAQVRADPLVKAAAPRVQAQVLASSPREARNLTLLGIDPAAEYRVTFIHRAVVEGAPLAPGQDREIVVGIKLAAKLGVRLGEKIVIMGQAADGTLGTAAYRISGIFATGSEPFDASIGFVSLHAAQDLLALSSGVSTIAVALKNRDDLPAAAASLRKRVGELPYAVITWHDLLPEVAQMIDYIKVIIRIVVAIVFTIVAMGVMNTLIMSVMERTRELGIMMALGTPPAAVVRMVLYESLCLALAGIGVGLVCGLLIVGYLGAAGIDMSRYTRDMQTIPGLTGTIYPRLTGAEVWIPVGMLLLTNMFAALYPAWRATRLVPVRAIRHG